MLVLVFELGSDQEVLAVWHYYGEGLTQAETAKALGVSRTTVANLLAAGRRRGLVTIGLAPDLLSSVKAARALRIKTGLQAAHVVPMTASSGAKDIRRALANAAVHLLDGRIADRTVLGVASGRTMAALGDAMPRRRRPDICVVQVSGSSLGDEASSPEACTLRIASRLGAHGYNFPAPAAVTSRSLRDALVKEPPLIRHFERIRSCSQVIFSVGEVNPGTSWAGSDGLTQAALPDYVKRGAACVIIGRFIDRLGNAVPGPLSGRQIGAGLADLLAIPQRICVAGGPEKTQAIRAAIAGGYITHLVTDTKTADKLLKS